MSGRRWLAHGALVLAAVPARPADAQPRSRSESRPDQALAECSEAYEQAQVLQRDGQLRAARERLIRCAQESCPSAQRTECSKWRADVEAALPTVVFDAKNERGEELVEVRVLVDGEVASERLDGRAVPMDPGQHSLRFESAGFPAIGRKILVREGEKNRRVEATFVAVRPKHPREQPATRGGEERPVPIPVFVLGGVGIAALGSFAVFGAVASVEESDAASQPCAPQGACPASDVDHVFVKQVVADVSLAVGIVAVGVAAVLYLTRPTVQQNNAARLPSPGFVF